MKKSRYYLQSFRITDDEKSHLQNYANISDMSISDVIRESLAMYMNAVPATPKRTWSSHLYDRLELLNRQS